MLTITDHQGNDHYLSESLYLAKQKNLPYTTRLMRMIGKSPDTVGEVENSKDLMAMWQVGKAYAEYEEWPYYDLHKVRPFKTGDMIIIQSTFSEHGIIANGMVGYIVSVYPVYYDSFGHYEVKVTTGFTYSFALHEIRYLIGKDDFIRDKVW